jgi:ATP-dependent Clp protease adaptor protein ClpS
MFKNEDKSDSNVQEKRKIIIKPPELYNVVLLNDNFTPMDFVVKILTEIFHKSQNQAVEIMMSVHKSGSGIAGTYIEDIANTKHEAVKEVAARYGFPLKTKVEKEL